MITNNPLAQEITAQIQLGLFGTVGKLSRQLRAIDRIAPRLKDGGIIRKIEVNRDKRRRAVGISSASRGINAFGGLLYAVGAVAHEITVAGSDISHTSQQSRLDVGDMSFLESDRRIKWKMFSLVYDLLEDIFAQDSLPDTIILDIPLVMGRAVYAQILEDSETDTLLRNEIGVLRDKLENFWERNLSKCYPFNPEGPLVVTLARRRFGSLLSLIEKKGQDISPDPIDGEIERLIKTEWVKVLSVGIERVLRGILVPEHRTAAFDQEQNLVDKWAFPQTLVRQGSLSFHYLTGLRGEPVQVETLGAASVWTGAGGAPSLDAVAGNLIALTYFDHKQSLPLPLWYAQQAVEVVKKKGLLEFYKQEALRAMREEQVDQAWMAGWEEE